jgi:hypothetical protein
MTAVLSFVSNSTCEASRGSRRESKPMRKAGRLHRPSGGLVQDDGKGASAASSCAALRASRPNPLPKRRRARLGYLCEAGFFGGRAHPGPLAMARERLCQVACGQGDARRRFEIEPLDHLLGGGHRSSPCPPWMGSSIPNGGQRRAHSDSGPALIERSCYIRLSSGRAVMPITTS